MSLREKIILVLGIAGIGAVGAAGIAKADEKEAIIEEKKEENELLKDKNEELVIDNQSMTNDITNQNKVIVSKNEKIKEKHARIIYVKNVKNERIEYLKKELKKKPKVVYKTKYKEKIVYKEKPTSKYNKHVSTAASVKNAKPVQNNVNAYKNNKKPTSKKTTQQASKKTGDYPTKKRKVIGSSGKTFQMTSYTADCNGCSGITATGVDVRNTTTYNGMKVVAVDPSVIPLGSVIRVTTSSGSFTAKALDTGGAIKGNIIDLLVGSNGEARSNGRQSVKVEILN